MPASRYMHSNTCLAISSSSPGRLPASPEILDSRLSVVPGLHLSSFNGSLKVISEHSDCSLSRDLLSLRITGSGYIRPARALLAFLCHVTFPKLVATMLPSHLPNTTTIFPRCVCVCLLSVRLLFQLQWPDENLISVLAREDLQQHFCN